MIHRLKILAIGLVLAGFAEYGIGDNTIINCAYKEGCRGIGCGKDGANKVEIQCKENEGFYQADRLNIVREKLAELKQVASKYNMTVSYERRLRQMEEEIQQFLRTDTAETISSNQPDLETHAQVNARDLETDLRKALKNDTDAHVELSEERILRFQLKQDENIENAAEVSKIAFKKVLEGIELSLKNNLKMSVSNAIGNRHTYSGENHPVKRTTTLTPTTETTTKLGSLPQGLSDLKCHEYGIVNVMGVITRTTPTIIRDCPKGQTGCVYAKITGKFEKPGKKSITTLGGCNQNCKNMVCKDVIAFTWHNIDRRAVDLGTEIDECEITCCEEDLCNER